MGAALDRQDRLRQHGRRLYVLAWGIEAIAVLAGLSIALALGLDAAVKAGGNLLSLDVLLASGGFLIVACAELTKIPVATTLVHAHWKWKPALLALLALMSVITFETVFFSLERGFTLRMLEVEEQRHVVDRLDDERRALEADMQRSTGVAADTDQLLTGAADDQRRPILERIEQLEAELDGLRANSLPPAAADLDRRIADLDRQITLLRDRREAEKRERIDRFERQRDSYVRRIDEARTSGDETYMRQMQAELGRLAYPTKDIEAITARYAEQIAKLDGEMVELRNRRNDLVLAPAPEVVARIDALRRQIDAARGELREVDRSRASLFERRNEQALDRADAVAAGEVRLREVAAALVVARAELAQRTELDQVHRIAAFWFDKPPAKVNSQEAKQVAALWFGSVAALAALAGAATAILGECLLRLSEIQSPARRPRGLIGQLRRWLVLWRWHRVRTVERIVEKVVEGPPVEKIIEKIVETIVPGPPVEKIVEIIVERPFKEFVYVPILTDDPEAVRTALGRDLPAEVADVLRTSPWRDGYAGST